MPALESRRVRTQPLRVTGAFSGARPERLSAQVSEAIRYSIRSLRSEAERPAQNYNVCFQISIPAMSDATSTARNLNRRRLLLACAAVVGAYTTPAWAEGETGDPAARQIRAFCDSLVDVMKQARQLGVRGRYEKLAAPIRETFDLPAMTRIAVGSDWSSI